MWEGESSRVLKNSFFDARRAIQEWIANFDEFYLVEMARSDRIQFWPIVVEQSQEGFFQHPARNARRWERDPRGRTLCHAVWHKHIWRNRGNRRGSICPGYWRKIAARLP